MNWAHVHLALNHGPIVGSIAAALLLVGGFSRRSQDVIRAGLVGFVVVGMLGGAVYWTGEPAEDRVEALAGVSEAAIERHEASAVTTAVLLGACGLASLAALAAWRAPRRVPPWVAIGLAVAAVAPIASAAWTANLGARIRHPEITADRVAAAETPGETLAPVEELEDR